VFETERCVVRDWRPQEAPRLLDLYRRWEVARWLGTEPHAMESLEQARQRIVGWAGRNAEDRRFGHWAVERRSDGVVAGTVVLVPLPDGVGEVEVGWHLHPDSWGSGLATEAARGALAHAYQRGVEEVLAVVRPDNDRSLAVCRRLGMQPLGRTTRYYGTELELFRRRWPALVVHDLSGYRGGTERLVLRPCGVEDLEAFHDLHSRDEVTRFLPFGSHDAAASRASLGRQQTVRFDREGDAVSLGGFDRATGRLVGLFMLFLRSVEHGNAELGYLLHPDFWGRGLATEGAAHLLGLAFGELGVRRVLARIDARNAASAGVLRRLGMRQEAHLVQNELFKGEWADEDRFAILRTEWEARGSG